MKKAKMLFAEAKAIASRDDQVNEADYLKDLYAADRVVPESPLLK